MWFSKRIRREYRRCITNPIESSYTPGPAPPLAYCATVSNWMSDRSNSNSSRRRLLSCNDHAVLGLFEKRDHLLARYGREALEKIIDRVASLQTVDQRLNRNASARKNGRAAHDIRR